MITSNELRVAIKCFKEWQNTMPDITYGRWLTLQIEAKNKLAKNIDDAIIMLKKLKNEP